ncbi:hypothetical protein I546_5085 [Mycobacterium kansasii 732]|uniref:Immunity protein 52 domain-containing protein n=1 Tax=Mycobacterium pseudokansasii TaxID=2341080 RepID=A0A498QXU9_9MYCO|nr:Imm52 family immunity protein [Mycobacterium pseudokansasii]EUA07676.1 hypothetical protein I546_5085 [Mycobacterium kansasii 732]MBY0443123.1 hypothetical protein [Mycobacteriaceae bacterium]VBA54953.1 hypothetical protein LAUMK142_04883 [Mycobacterium pseudokansasii]
MTKSNVSVGWGARVESVDQAADRVAKLLPALAALDPALSSWCDLGRSKREATAKPLVTTNHADLVQRLQDGRHRTDVGRQIMEDMGYSVYWWNGAEDNQAAANLNIHIGSSALGNHVVLKLPEPDAVPSLYTRGIAHKLLHIFVDIFDPDSVLWSNEELLAKQTEPDRPTEDGRGYVLGKLVGHPAGWANFLSDSDSVKFDMALLPAGATVERLGTGTLVLLGQDPANPPLRDVLQVRRAMGYEVPTQQTESSEDLDAASAGSAAAPLAPGASVSPTDRGQSDPRSGIETRGVGDPASNTDARRSDAQRGTTAHD